MKKKKMLSRTSFTILVTLIGGSLIIGGCKQNDIKTTDSSKETSSECKIDREIISQVSTLNSLMAGNYDGIDSVDILKKTGDIGLGTFEGLDGEMIVVDGQVYQAKASGEVNIAPETIKVPFSAVTFFDKDVEAKFQGISNIENLKTQIDNLIKEKDAFYAIRVDGTFSHVKVRSVPKQDKPYKILSEVTKNQPTFEYQDIKGTIVGFWSPDYVGGINVPGYHLHFISDDKTKGGHLLEVSMISGDVTLDSTRGFIMGLGDEKNSNSKAAVTKEDIEKVEK
ncbi:acetolactate decarboxylase [Clostridium cellulovorans]|uniref:Alpha-acetolactate decarboxylase n=1 Tax=Clostridium cellulovorans (strain ATCC 35296 / DSM 3052 / OCM 3 / 743B) TaxID=573061 RepID=D9ST61_CLOC7|nr:acetolactate decarboxylase [Clostridium cellulovorans]ADL50677.1 alpha-acetolactate decarboxylase [Clostridium cellulovorans 743B]